MQPNLRLRREHDEDLPYLVWRFDRPQLAVASGPLGGGIGLRRWAINGTVTYGYDRHDPDRHLGELADREQLTGDGVGLLTAVDVRHRRVVVDDGVTVVATVGISEPMWAAVPPDHPTSWAPTVGTINVVAHVPERLSDAALVNAVATVAEAKAQAFTELGLAGTGTPTDAVCLWCPPDGDAHPYGGPRSVWGARLARATRQAVADGAVAQAEWKDRYPDAALAPIPAPGPPLHLRGRP